ncbi:MAG: FtsX-like permease family protein [Nitrososphaerota archaeon]|nr:FtsX-like permease family protein [Candidatus Bathyarchaeota archaeon]MDW8048947.1 FtsX-like permease family protein [Nitrososphaerota archaeon]
MLGLRFLAKTVLVLLSLLICLNFIPLSTQADGSDMVNVRGVVLDDETGCPLPGAQVIFWSIDKGALTVTTDLNGYFFLQAMPKGFYTIYCYCDRKDTPGIDYVPFRQHVHLTEDMELSFNLLPGASVRVEGEFRPFESMQIIRTIVFHVDGIPEDKRALSSYGSAYAANQILRLDGRSVIVPSNMPVKVNVEIYLVDGSVRRVLIDSSAENISVSQGGLLRLDLRNLYLKSEVQSGSLYRYLEMVREYLEENKKLGFFVFYEETRLTHGEKLIEAATAHLAEGDYDAVYADLRESYLIIMDVANSLLSMRSNASATVYFITPFLASTALAFSFVIFDERHRQLLVSISLYILLLILLYHLYPGYSIFQSSTIMPWYGAHSGSGSIVILTVSSFLASYLIIFILPRFFSKAKSDWGISIIGALSAAFSISARNLRRRKLRAALTSIFLFTAVFAFVTLTSFSYESGLASIYMFGRIAPPYDGVIVRKPTEDELRPYDSIETAVTLWLKGRRGVTVVAPKVESVPQMYRIGYLENEELGLTFEVQGLVGIFPRLEENVSEVKSCLLNGRFLGDDDLTGILISAEASKALKVGVNETVKALGQRFIVVGVFDGRALEGVREMDGTSFVPIYLVSAGMDIVPAECSGGKVIIVHANAASKLTQTVTSRVAVRSTQSLEELARLTVLNWPNIECFICIGGKITRMYIGSYYKTSGFAPLAVPLIMVVLNVGLVVLASVYERRREVSILSTVGLNPFQITAVFLAEAVVIGIIAGSIGYILGVSSYRFLALLGFPLDVKIKTEAIWCILAFCFSIGAAVLGAAVPANRASTVVTPSTLKKWRIEREPKNPDDPWILNIPLRVPPKSMNDLFEFIQERLRRYADGQIDRIDVRDALWRGVKKADPKTAEENTSYIKFMHIQKEKNMVTTNTLLFTETGEQGSYGLLLISKTREGTSRQKGRYFVHQTASLIRRLILEYTAERAHSENLQKKARKDMHSQ